MKDIKEYLGVIILIGGIMLIISVFTPIIQYFQPGGVSFSWMWGLGYYNYVGYGSELYFWLFSNPNFILILWDLIFLLLSLTIFIGSLVLIIMGSRLRIGRINIKDKEKELAKIGVLMILVPIVYVITSYILGNIYLADMGYGWGYELWSGGRGPGFAFFGPFIGGALVIISVIASKNIKSGDFKAKTPIVAKIGQLNYCPQCGQKLPSKEGKFCISCGFEISK